MTLNSDVPIESSRTSEPRLDDAETIILMAATNREDGIALPIPDSVTASADQVARRLKRLIKLSLLQEVPAKLENGLWRKSADDRHLTLKITPLAFDILGLDLPQTPAGGDQAADAVEATVPAPLPAPNKAVKSSGVTRQKKTRTMPPKGSRKPEKAGKRDKISKTEVLLTLLERSKGASLDELMKASGWQAHSVRGFLSAVVKKKLRLKLTSEAGDTGVRRYRVKPRAKA